MCTTYVRMAKSVAIDLFGFAGGQKNSLIIDIWIEITIKYEGWDQVINIKMRKILYNILR